MGIAWRKSRFNYVVRNQSGYLIYNTLYNSLTRLNTDEYARYSCLDFISEDECEAFQKQGLIVREAVDELARYQTFTSLAAKYMQSTPSLTVTPTMECNASCFYCYENGVRRGRMSEEQAHQIIDTIKTLDLSCGLNLTWFGGEPLMNPEWMDYFSNCLRTENIAFSAFLITNGSLLNEDLIARMKDTWNIRSVQISMDGSADEYVERKAYQTRDETIYYRLLRNIRNLSKAGLSVQLRMNIDRDNIDSILTLADNVGQLFSSDGNVTFYPAFLTGAKAPMNRREKIDIIKRIIQADTYNKLPMNRYLYSHPKVSACYYFQKHSFSVDTSGRLYICERMLGFHGKAIGNISQGMDLSNVSRELSGQRDTCQHCVFLPKCQGGCQDAYMSGDDPCFIEKYAIPAYLECL